MNKNKKHEVHCSSNNELILNYKQQMQSLSDMFLPVWENIWRKFSDDAYSYAIAWIPQNSQRSNEDTHLEDRGRKTSHSFSFAYYQNALKRVINLHERIDILSEVRKKIGILFGKIVKFFLSHCNSRPDENKFFVVVQTYSQIKNKISIVIQCLALALSTFITKQGLEEEFFTVLNKFLVDDAIYDKYVRSTLEAVQSVREECLSARSVRVDTKVMELGAHQQLVLKNLSLLCQIKIFPYLEYVEESKKYYNELMGKIPKNIYMYAVLYSLTKWEKKLEQIVFCGQWQEQRMKKVLKLEQWRPLQRQPILKVFCKQVLQKLYEQMIEYVDYLVGLDFFDKKVQGSNQQDIMVNEEQRKNILKSLWQLTKILEKNLYEEKDKNKYDKNAKNRPSPSTELLKRFLLIASDIKKYIQKPIDQRLEINSLYNVLKFRDHLLSLLKQCFDNDSKFINAVTAKMEESIVDEQDLYNKLLSAILLSKNYKFPGVQPISLSQYETPDGQMFEESENEPEKKITQLNNISSFQLFKMTPSKEQFIRKFEQEFSSTILMNWDSVNLLQQEHFIKVIHKQCGYNLSKSIERMLHDVWRNQKPIFSVEDKFLCRILCQDWPQFPESKFKLANSLFDMRNIFQQKYLGRPENEKKKLKWVQQFGKIYMRIGQTESCFSELESSIIMVLSRSFRPMVMREIKQILQYQENDLSPVFQNLKKKNILIHHIERDSYEVNFENKQAYILEGRRRIEGKAQKKSVQKDIIIVIEAYIARILKRKKSVQKTELLSNQLKIEGMHVTVEQIHTALERLVSKQIIIIEKTRGIVKYLE